MSERKLKKMFKEGDEVIVKKEGVERTAVIQNFLSSQYTVKYEDGNAEFFFYNEACPMRHINEPEPKPKRKRRK